MRPLVLLACFVPALAAAGAPARDAAVELASGVHLLPGTFVAGAQPDGNTVVIEGSDGLVVFDSGRRARHAETIIEHARVRALPVVAIVNSHWHLDHVGGNLRLREAWPQARVYASAAIDDALPGFLARYRGQLEQALAGDGGDARARQGWRDEIALIDAGPRLVPDERILAGGDRPLAGRRVRIGLEARAVTAGDVWLLEHASGVLAAGDLVTLPAPLFDTACPARWRSALARLAAQDFRVLVPGHGAPMSREAFARWRSAYGHLLDCAAGAQPDAACIDGWIAGAGELLPASQHAFARDLLAYYMKKHLRAAPSAATHAACADG